MAKNVDRLKPYKKQKKLKPTPGSVPCLRVNIGDKPGKSGMSPRGCVVVGENRGSAKKFELGKKFGATSKSVQTPKKNKPCFGTQNRKGCPVQLAFDKGQPFLRFCVKEKEAGHRVDVNTPAEATATAAKVCDVWKATGKFDFPAGTPLKGKR